MIGSVRREYHIRLRFNGRQIKRVLIDPHYEQKHSGSIQDAVILGLVRLLDWTEYPVEAQTKSGFEIFRIEPLVFEGKSYRLIVTLPPLNGEHETDYLGVVNAFRIRIRKRTGG